MVSEAPFFRLFGRDPRFPIEDIIIAEKYTTYIGFDNEEYMTSLLHSLRPAWSTAYQYNQKAQRRMKEHYDRTAIFSPFRGDGFYSREPVKPGHIHRNSCTVGWHFSSYRN